MIPAKGLWTYMYLSKRVKELMSLINILSKIYAEDRRETGPEQTLLILGNKDGESQLISTLQDIASTLPVSNLQNSRDSFFQFHGRLLFAS